VLGHGNTMKSLPRPFILVKESFIVCRRPGGDRN
jgi:hypothetical protein